MRFHLSDEQQNLFDTVQRLASEHAEGKAARQAIESDNGFDAELWRALADLGVAGAAASEDHGGVGLSVLDLAIIAEALGAAAAPGPFLGHTLAVLALEQAGSEAQKAAWLPRLASGEAIGSVALEEVEGATRPSIWSVALKDGRLSGIKINVSYAPQADLIVVGCAYGQLALVAQKGEGKATPVDDVDRTRRLWTLDLDGVEAELLAHADTAFCERLCDAALVLLAADAVGGANRLLDMAVEHVKTRHQFGGPIGRFQGIKHQLANLVCAVEPVRSLSWYAAYAFDREPENSARAAAIAKAHVSDVFMNTGREVVQLHGGMGYTWDFDVQIWLKRAIYDYALMGTPPNWRVGEGSGA
jgi:alkylation response protein AidB-like acyl-CoA dehydrogenase